MKKKLRVLGVMLVFSSLMAWAEVIEKIVITGNQKIAKETVQFYMKTREGEPFSEERLRGDFNTLWETGFFADIKFEAETGTTGKIVTIIVVENPVISSVTYKTGRKVKQEDIVQKLQENNVSILSSSYLSPYKLKKIEKIIMDMLIEKGYQDGKVNIEQKLTNGQVALTVKVDSGPKTRIGDIVFPGLKPKSVPPAFLRRGFKNNRFHGLLSALLAKDIYKKEKIAEDLEEVQLRLQQRGYLEAKVGTPELSMVHQKNAYDGKTLNMLKISVPVEMGQRYKVGAISIEGNKVLRAEALKMLIKLKKGQIYDIKKRNKGIEEIQKIYGTLGYFYAQVVPTENLDPVKKVADLAIRIQENEVVYLGKLEFTGNTYTKDHVIRREWFLREGKRLNSSALEDSIRRMKQLGLVTLEKMPEIKPDPQDPQKINITAEVKELNRQSINFNIGYSGYDGWFIALGYSTQNFLGLGETFTLNLQTGTRSQNYQFAFTEPYLFNLPANFGIDVFKTSYQIPYSYTRHGEGFNISSAARFWRYFGLSLIYGYENIEITDVSADYQAYNPYAFYYYTEGKRLSSYISPTIYYSTVDSPLFPSSGTKYLATYRYSGGILGGDIYLHRLKLEFVKFVPIFRRRNILGFHVAYERVSPFGGKALPFYERFFLGGERSIRGFDIYRIGPRSTDGLVMGGDKSLIMNFEYSIPLSQQFSIIYFYDIGNTYDVGKGINFRDFYSSTGIELKIFIPMLGVPFRLIFAYNPRVLSASDSHFQFRFAVGPSFY